MSKRVDVIRERNYERLRRCQFSEPVPAYTLGIVGDDITFLLSELDRKDKVLRRIAEMPFPHRVGFADCVAIARAALAEQEEAWSGTIWLNFGQFHCSIHRQGIPFFNPPDGAKCAECSNDAPESYL